MYKAASFPPQLIELLHQLCCGNIPKQCCQCMADEQAVFAEWQVACSSTDLNGSWICLGGSFACL
jgi:hypothetical protein